MLCLAPQLWERSSGPRDSSSILSGGAKPCLNTAVPCYFLGHLLLMITRPWVDRYQLLRTNPPLQVGTTQLLLWWSTPPPERLGALQGNKRSGWFSFKGKTTWSLGHLLQPSPPSFPHPLSWPSLMPGRSQGSLRQSQVPHSAKCSHNPPASCWVSRLWLLKEHLCLSALLFQWSTLGNSMQISCFLQLWVSFIEVGN